MASLTESRPPHEGRDHTYTLDPAPRPGCEVLWFINGQSVSMHDRVGGLRVAGFGQGTMSVVVEDDGAMDSTEISVRMECPGLPPVQISGMPVGSGTRTDAPPAPIPAGGAADIGDFVFRAVPWPWWRRLLGFCPEKWYMEDGTLCTCKGERLSGGIPFIYYTIECKFDCNGRQQILSWTLSFGVVIEGPR